MVLHRKTHDLTIIVIVASLKTEMAVEERSKRRAMAIKSAAKNEKRVGKIT